MSKLSFGRYSRNGGVDIMFINSGYLKWLMDEDWFPDKYPNDFNAVEEELNRRDYEHDHFYEDKVKI